MPTLVAGAREHFEREGYVIVRQLLSPARARRLCSAARKLDTPSERRGDRMVAGAYARYAWCVGEQLLLDLRAKLSHLTSVELAPTYSYLRIYHRGDILPPHHDRAACEVSASLTLDHDCVRAWPLWIAGRTATRPVQLAPGDGVVYRGIECEHWRSRFRGRWQCQVFLHYVDRRGPHRHWENDLRERVGEPYRSSRSPARGGSM
jgi:alkylated DNA repair dioxygenase AlkB